MIPVLALLLAATGPADTRPARTRYDECVKETDRNPAAAEKAASDWAADGGGVLAAQCLGIALSAQSQWKGALDAFTAGATLSERTRDGRAATLWTSAGDAALAGGDAAGARAALDRAIAVPGFGGPLRGEALLDRARADVALSDLPGARSDINAALPLVDGDPMAWLLSATLARRMGDAVRAKADIHEAELRAPDEPDILFEAGNIAAAAGQIGEARAQWARAVGADPHGPAGQAAAKELAATGGEAPSSKTARPVPQGR